MPKDFSGQNLRGHSFKGQNLEGANFSGADIRGADFTRANLKGTNFSHAQAGLQRRWAIFLICLSWLVSGISGFFSALTGVLINYTFTRPNHLEAPILSLTFLIVTIVIFIVILRQGLNSTVAIVIAITIAFAFAVPIAFAVADVRIGIFTALSGPITYAGVFTIALVIVLAIAYAYAIAFALTLALSYAYAIALSGAIPLFIAYAIAYGFANDGAEAYAKAYTIDKAIALVIAYAITFAIAIAIALFSAYIAWRAMKGDRKYSLIRDIAVAFAAFGGTSFRNADLTDANFTAATLKSTDFRQANLIRICFSKTKKLDRVRPGTTYLQKSQVRQVLVRGQGQDKNFDREDLRGVNFQGANLIDASFIGADLSQANLQDADLSRAKLVQTQLDGTDFTGTTLTGAYIQDWGITTSTRFDRVRCEYVYMRLPTEKNPEHFRKPDNHKEVFADGEFGDFIQPIFDTLDLYHNQGVDPRAIAISLKQLAENHPEADLRIVGMEVRGEDKFLLRAKTAATANKSELSAEYFTNYNQLKNFTDREIKLLLAEKDNQIDRLENLIKTALESSSFYVNNSIIQGDTKMTGNRTINMGSGNYNERIEGDYVQGNKYTAGDKQSLAEAAAEIQKLLKQLEQTNPTATEAQKEAFVSVGIAPTKKERLINAFIEGGKGAIEEFLDNPYVNVAIKIIEGWKNA